MNWDRIEGNWKQLKGKIKEQWGELTDDDIDRIAGRKDQLAGHLQETYGIGKDEAEAQIDKFGSRYENWDFRDTTPPGGSTGTRI
ncbi:MAG TPA: CsbD family protein [Casimicrobiaceae bacterium]|nr:CsbD family protein [Casimicrobiaceae bacterium]